MVKLPVYMDCHATTPADTRVVEAMLPFFTEHFGNAASVQHRYGWIAKEAVERSRKQIALLMNAQPQEIIFTGSATESNNLAIKGAAEAYRSKGNHIITTQTEHQCVLSSCRMLERNGFTVTYLPVDAFGSVTAEDVKNAMTEQTILVSVMMANNEIGTIQPVEEIGAVCKERGIIVHTDATQAAGRLEIDVERMGIDLLSLTSHKLYGPKGVGALYKRSRNPRIAVEPQIHGAGHEHGLRSGTLNVPGIVGFGKAVQIAAEEMVQENARVFRLRNVLQEHLLSIDGTTMNGHPSQRLPNNLSITFGGVHADQLMTALSDIAVSSGSACTSEDTDDVRFSHVLRAIGLDAEAGRSTVRFGLGRFTTADEVEFVSEQINITIARLREQSSIGIS